MKILVTGAAGNIGCGLCHHLEEQGHEVVATDNFRNGYLKNLDGFKGKVIIGDIEDENFVNTNLMESWNVIIHLSAISSLPDCETNKAQCLRINVIGVSNMLELARHTDAYLIHASTSAVYENTISSNFSEDLEINPTLYYALSKKMSEDLINAYTENYGIRVGVLRFFNVFGPDGDHTRPNPPLINFLVREFTKGYSPVLSGDGSQVRDFIHVDDVRNMIEICIEKQPSDVFNVCTGVTCSVNQIGEWVRESLETDLPLAHKDAQDLWDCYPHLFEGPHPLKKEIVAKETTRYSKGIYHKSKEQLGWEPNLDIKGLVKKVAKEIVI
tara:strand:- start:1914 stop:2894 length:981 start_codon:yes stop_codon:yes gene_type:complete